MSSDAAKYKTIGQRLRQARLSLNWSQKELARNINTTAVSISRWESGLVLPQPHYRERLCQAFNTTAASLFGTDRVEDGDEEATLPEFWNVPYRRNPLFTGRNDILATLASVLHRESTLALNQAISGLGGIGKTQTILEYAYRYREDYSSVLWLRADTREILIEDLVALAELLDLPEKGEQDQQHMVEAIKRWLHMHDGWLLILDNVEDIMMVGDILPPVCNGHTVLTTRSQATGSIAQRIDMAPMHSDEAILFLLRRAKLIEQDADLAAISGQTREEAGRICHLLGDLPLALDQAGAYIEETGCSLGDYLDCYQVRRAELLHLRGRLNTDHPQSVAATLSLSFENVAQTTPEAVELLRLCAFLYPEGIPKEMLSEGAPYLGSILQDSITDPLQFDRILAALRMYSLLQRNANTNTLTIHRLVQAVLRDSMDQEMQRQWAERAVHAINHAFPQESRKPSMRTRCQNYLPHALACITLIDEWQIYSPEAAHLLHKTGCYLMESSQYEKCPGPEHGEVAFGLNSLANTYHALGKFEQAEAFFRRALDIREKIMGSDHPDVVSIREELAALLLTMSGEAPDAATKAGNQGQ